MASNASSVAADLFDAVFFAGEVGGQAVLGRQIPTTTPWLTERHGYDPTSVFIVALLFTGGVAF